MREPIENRLPMFMDLITSSLPAGKNGFEPLVSNFVLIFNIDPPVLIAIA